MTAAISCITTARLRMSMAFQARPAASGHIDRAVDLGIGCVGDLADAFFGRGFDHVEMLGRLAGLIAAAHEKLA